MRTLARLLDTTWLSIAVALMLATTVAVICQVLFRYVLGLPLIWTEELARVCLVGSAYAALPAVYLRGEQVVVDIAIRVLPKYIQFWYIVCLKVVALLTILYYAYGSFLQINATRELTLISLPFIRVWYLYAFHFMALLAFALSILVTWADTKVYTSSNIGDGGK